MKITIDTRTDSKEEIRKLIKFLENLNGETYVPEQNFPTGENVLGMFDSGPVKSDEEESNKKDFSLDNLQTY